ncbi:MAG: cyclic nucleotide-binding domain-containing protein [Candidatus Gracilibacteria bacterium]|nr:cyclic nucleotide-binding domain-containing protein [Candidatus Gracilibacteria bacterium]
MSLVDGIKLLADLSQSEKDNLSLFCQEKLLNAGEVLFYEQDEASAMYLLKEGKIEISRMHEGEKIILGDVQAEEILGEMALFGDSNKRMATATALEDCILVVVLGFSIKDLTKKYPELLEKIKMIINDRMINNKNLNNSK